MNDQAGITRREWLAGASALLAQAGFAPLVEAQAPETAPGGRIVRGQEPVNLEFPFASLRDFLVPTDQFYVRNHFPQPAIDPGKWRLRVEGLVRQPLELTYDELRRLPSRTEPVLLECAGNNRSSLVPKTRGVQWGQGAVGTAEWTGVPLRAILQRAGVRPDAVEVVLEGADAGEVAEGPGRIHFARGIPVEKARADVLLVHGMSGAPLPAAHGFPVRAVVPGWYGVSSVKWLSRILVTDQPFRGYFQSVDYTVWKRPQGIPVLTPITELSVKAQIARPVAGEVVTPGLPYRVFGAAWTGETDVTRVDVSTDGGRSWKAARLLGKPVRNAWRLWEYEWRVPDFPARHALLARATDARGRRQPLERDRDLRNYMITQPLVTEVEARRG